MLAPVFTMQPDGARIYAPAGRPLEAGDVLDQPGLVRALELLAAEGPDSPYVGLDRRGAASGVEGIAVSRSDLERYEPAGSGRPRSSGRAIGCSPAPGSPASPRRSRGCRRSASSTPPPACSRCSPRSTGRAPTATRRTSSPPTPEGNACVLTTSLGLGTGDFLPGLDLHLNSMLGEVDLVLEPLEAGRADAAA